MVYSQMIGNKNELLCMIAFMELGFDCSIPYGNGARYDFIIDDGNKLYKILCKSSSFTRDHGNIRTDSITVNTSSTNINSKGTTNIMYSSSEIDYFATYFEGKVYVIPVEECGYSKVLRFLPPANGCVKYSNADDYLITNVFSPSEKFTQSKTKYFDNIESLRKPVKQYFCPDCGKLVSVEGVRCPSCSHKIAQKVERPSKDELLKLILTKSFCEIGRIYSVTDNAIRKWCKQYGLPSRKCDIKEIINNLDIKDSNCSR